MELVEVRKSPVKVEKVEKTVRAVNTVLPLAKPQPQHSITEEMSD